ncbi:MAG: transposase [Burkholderiaceae bacterium]
MPKTPTPPMEGWARLGSASTLPAPGRRSRVGSQRPAGEATQGGSRPVTRQLDLPNEWCEDAARCAKAGAPKDLAFATKPAIASTQIERLQRGTTPRRIGVRPGLQH